MKELGAAMAKAQAEIKSAKKDAANPFFKSKYADLASVVSACRDAFAKHGLSVIQATDFDEQGMWLETYLMHASGEFIKGRYPIRPLKNDPQSVGSAISYAKRYTYAAIAGVVTGDEDDDGNAASNRTDSKPSQQEQQATVHDDDAEPVDEKLAVAKAFVKKAIKEVGECRSISEVDAWYGTWTRHIVKIKKDYPEEAEILTAAINAQRGSFSAREAAE